MSVANSGPKRPDPNDPQAMDNVRKGNPALVYRDEQPTDAVQAASTRASAVIMPMPNRPRSSSTEPTSNTASTARCMS